VGEAADLQRVYDTERPLLYVACTRARDCLRVSGVETASKVLEELDGKRREGTAGFLRAAEKRESVTEALVSSCRPAAFGMPQGCTSGGNREKR
jgi:ATP-dependent exoDNAse (exonuclease V) beta subunit